MDTIIRWLEAIVDFISGQLQSLIIFLMMILVLVDVISRYILKAPLSIAEEYGGYMLVAVTCIGLAYAWQHRSHVRVEFIINSLPVKARRIVRLFTLILAFVFTAVMACAAYELVSISFMFGTRSGSWLRTPVAWPLMTIIVGAALIFIQLLVEILKAVKGLKSAQGEGE